MERPPPTLLGALKLSDYMYNPPTEPGVVRRSARLGTSRLNGAGAHARLPPPSPSPSPTPKQSSRPSPSSIQKKRLISDRPDFRSSTPKKRKPTSPHFDMEDDASSSSSPSSLTERTQSPRSQSPRKRSRPSSGYAPPSTYAHLPALPDAIAPNLLVLFVGLNPGIETARTGHAYAHPTNLFWRLLYSSGVTPRLCSATEDRHMPELYSLGLTNIVSRPSRNGAELSKSEMDAGVDILHDKVRRWRPECVCIVGKSIWESLWRVRHGRSIKKDEFKYGWQDSTENMGVGEVADHERADGVTYKEDSRGDKEGWNGAPVFVASSTSGLAATLKPAEKEAIWRELGSWVEQRRSEREGSKKG
ncbi:DNA glycosylase [Diplogelasinospora grovesii]|uniref:DNA glycosylase n=1 Tax=Diplogelasinospora grovesii TaxID=303347 RepID=A0AAN6S6Z4_9PEZI|nr:DNA glycosylase [Diplogelasinospora grovesii]